MEDEIELEEQEYEIEIALPSLGVTLKRCQDEGDNQRMLARFPEDVNSLIYTDDVESVSYKPSDEFWELVVGTFNLYLNLYDVKLEAQNREVWRYITLNDYPVAYILPAYEKEMLISITSQLWCSLDYEDEYVTDTVEELIFQAHLKTNDEIPNWVKRMWETEKEVRKND